MSFSFIVLFDAVFDVFLFICNDEWLFLLCFVLFWPAFMTVMLLVLLMLEY